MAYSSIRGRKPLERASKISHSTIINNDSVKDFLARCTVPQPADKGAVAQLLQDIPPTTEPGIRAVVTVDGSYREVFVREEYPSATITFFAFGPLLFNLSALYEISAQPFIAPEDMARLKNIQRYNLVLPTRNISRDGKSLRDSVRAALHDFFAARHSGDEPLSTALRWILFRGWTGDDSRQWEIEQCPNYGCTRSGIVLTPGTKDEEQCSTCGGPIYLIDALRLHERVDYKGSRRDHS